MREFFGLTARDLENLIGAIGNERYRARQLFQWVYQKGVFDFSAMTDISKSLRTLYASMFDTTLPPLEEVLTSRDGSTKFGFLMQDGSLIESVLIPEENRTTLCVSCQVGCRMGCRFCVTGRIGFIRNLSVSEIVTQVVKVKEYIGPQRITNIVFMGMGEPLDNLSNVEGAMEILKHPLGLDFSYRRVTLSTVGLIDGLTRLEPDSASLAISLNAADNETRTSIMPINRLYPVEALIDFVRNFKGKRRTRITFEYVLIGGVNDRPEDVQMLAKLLAGVKCKINLIPLNESPHTEFKAPAAAAVEHFHRYLLERHFTAIIRDSRGRDVFGGCGQLGIKYLEEGHEGTTAGL
jgi:23S rRNA (adenine2503-C2)-methyltransferase